MRFDSYLLLVRAGGPGSEAPDKLQNLDVAELPTHWEGRFICSYQSLSSTNLIG